MLLFLLEIDCIYVFSIFSFTQSNQRKPKGTGAWFTLSLKQHFYGSFGGDPLQTKYRHVKCIMEITTLFQ